MPTSSVGGKTKINKPPGLNNWSAYPNPAPTHPSLSQGWDKVAINTVDSYDSDVACLPLNYDFSAT